MTSLEGTIFKNQNGQLNAITKQSFFHIPVILLAKGNHGEFQALSSLLAQAMEGCLERYNSVHTLFWHVPLLSHFKTLCIFQEIIFR